MPESAPFQLQLTRTFKVPRERVFRAWTDPAELRQWFRADPAFTVSIAEVDLQVGGRYRLAMQPPEGDAYVMGGTYREVTPPERLVFTWTWEGDDDNPETLVTLEFRDRGGETEVVLTHSGFASEEQRGNHEDGWNGCLDQLGGFLAAA
jgi:uncharacterized protein YndB with AHSA1/START domain